MATKHIADTTWRRIEKETVKAVIKTQKAVKETDMLNFLIIKGLENITEKDYPRVRK